MTISINKIKEQYAKWRSRQSAWFTCDRDHEIAEVCFKAGYEAAVIDQDKEIGLTKIALEQKVTQLLHCEKVLAKRDEEIERLTEILNELYGEG